MMMAVIIIVLLVAVAIGLYASIICWVIYQAHRITDNPIIDNNGVTREELQAMLDKYPADAKVVIEYCNVRVMTYDPDSNMIRID